MFSTAAKSNAPHDARQRPGNDDDDGGGEVVDVGVGVDVVVGIVVGHAPVVASHAAPPQSGHGRQSTPNRRG